MGEGSAGRTQEDPSGLPLLCELGGEPQELVRRDCGKLRVGRLEGVRCGQAQPYAGLTLRLHRQ